MTTNPLYSQYDERLLYCKPQETFMLFLLTLRCARHYKNDPVYFLPYGFLLGEGKRSVILQAPKNAVSSNSFFEIE